MPELGMLYKIDDLRSIWPHEERDFSKWLSEEQNLSKLSDAVGIEIVLQELESSVGGFSVDLFANEEGTGRKIIIENQLEETDHDHLGKIITYASGKGAEVIIWIVKHARDEHRQAFEWLNQHTNENIGFFLIEIELWKIDNSRPAPQFNIIEKPNDWTKAMKAVEGMTETKKLQYDFWQAFCDYAFIKPVFNSNFSKRKPSAQHWYDVSVGNSACHVSFTVNTQKRRIGTEIYIDDDKALFNRFKQHETEIETLVGTHIDWFEATKACRILVTMNGDIRKGPDTWLTFFDWYCAKAVQMKQIVKQFSE